MEWQRNAVTQREGGHPCHRIRKILRICVMARNRILRMMCELVDYDKMVENAHVWK